jgi:hypothetical protein
LLRREKNGNLGRERKKARAMSERSKQKRLKAAVSLAKARKARQAYRDHQLGKLGAAGPCKRIDPKTGEVIEVITRRGTS